jgi:hypothetical protein
VVVKRREVWSLDSDGTLVIRVEEQRSDAAPIETTLRYKKTRAGTAWLTARAF